MAAPLTSVVGIMALGTWSLGYGLSVVTASAPDSPCADVTAHPETDTHFELDRIVASMKRAPRLPVRGK